MGDIDMKSIIITASIHHGNTRKVVDAIADVYGVEVVDATKVTEFDLSDYDLIGFASGVYGGNFHQKVMDFGAKNLPNGKNVFFIMTSAMNRDFSRSMMKAIADKDANVLGTFHCVGYNTFGPFKLFGGTGKGHPDATDLEKAVAFYKGITEKI